MHIMEGFLSPVWCLVWFVIALPFVIYGAKKIIELVREHPEQKMTVALAGAFIFLLSSLKIPSVTGSSSHPTGTGFSSVMYGVCATSFLSTIVLVFQALLLAHGGLTTLGANIFSMGIAGPFMAVAVWSILRKAGVGVPVSMMCGALVADLFTYVVTAGQMTLDHGASLDAFVIFLSNYAVTQVPLAIIEGILFFMFGTYLINNKPELFDIVNGNGGGEVGLTRTKRSGTLYIAGFAVIAVMVIATLAYGAANGFEFGGADDAAEGIIDKIDPGFIPWIEGIWGSYELPGETESLLFALQAAIGALIIGFFIGRYTRKSAKDSGQEPVRSEAARISETKDDSNARVPGSNPEPAENERRAAKSEQNQMDALAYSSRMLNWAPLGKLLLVVVVLVANITTKSLLVPFVTLAIGIGLMAYSTNFRIPRIVAIAIAEAFVILIFGCGMVSISGSSGEVIWDTDFLWMHIHMTVDSFNEAWLILLRGTAGISVMLAFATSTPIPHISLALKQIHMPVEVSEIVVLIYRYAFLLLERMEAMWGAAHSRMGFSGFRRTMSTVASIAVGIFVQSTNLSDKAQIALDCRNYAGYFPVYREPAKVGVKWVLVVVLAFVAIYLFGTYSEGWIDMATLLGVA